MLPQTVQDLQTFLKAACVPEGSYVIQQLGIGEVSGIGYLDGHWCTYYSERGAYRSVQAYASEAEAIAAFIEILRGELGQDGIHLP